MYINDIKNKIRQIWDNDTKLLFGYPENETLYKDNYKKAWISSILVEIIDFDNFVETNKENQLLICKTLKTFQEGIIEIFKNYRIKNFDIQGSKIYGFVRSDGQNSEECKRLFNCAMDINGFLKYFWNILEYRICLSLTEELIYFVDNNSKMMFIGNSVNKINNLVQKSKIKNQILLDKLFVINNKEILKTDDDNCFYQETINGECYSTYCCVDWKK